MLFADNHGVRIHYEEIVFHERQDDSDLMSRKRPQLTH